MSIEIHFSAADWAAWLFPVKLQRIACHEVDERMHQLPDSHTPHIARMHA